MYNNKLNHPFSWKMLTNKQLSKVTLNLLIFAIILNITQVNSTSKFISGDHSSSQSAILSDGPAIISADPPVDPSLPRTYVRGFKQQNPNVISIGAVLESQEAISHFLQVKLMMNIIYSYLLTNL